MSRLDVDVDLVRRSRAGEPFHLRAEFSGECGVTVVCGASGSGKSSLLLAILGALPGARGRIGLGARLLLETATGLSLPVRERELGMVFQGAPLFPHLDVLQNVAFGIRAPDRARRAHELLERTGAAELVQRRPHELSGGQAQRVALARALGPRPKALLLDEPFSALDVAARAALGELLVELQRESGIPFVHVTHDPGEALRIGSRLVLLDGGRVVQSGAPAEVLARPASVAAARTVGTENLFHGTVRRQLAAEGCTEVEIDGTTVQTSRLELVAGARVALGLRAEDLLLSLSEIRGTSARNVIPGVVRELVERGDRIEVRVTTPASFRVMVTPAAVRELGLEPDRRVWLLIKATAFHRLV